MEDGIDTKDLNRARWIIVDKRANWTTDGCSHGISVAASLCNSNSLSCGSSLNTSYDNPPPVAEQRVVVLRRLLKPEYYRALYVYAPNTAYINIDYSPRISSAVENDIYVDMSDRTMWIAVGDVMPLNEFYKMRVDNDLLDRNNLVGYTIDAEPSFGLVCMVDLKATFASWWCR